MDNSHKYVELKPGFEEFYPDNVIVGSRGWITKERTDSDRFDLVFIEWDKEHWRYSGQPDGWTFASHFREVEKTSDLLAKMKGSEDEELPRIDFDKALEEVSDVLNKSQGFIILTAVEVEDILNNDEIVTLPLVFSRFKTDEAAQALFAQLGHLNLILLTDLLRSKDESGRPPSDDFPSDI